ncbi:uncharacterized protein [Aquarana catesbeiana]|uniref:uncharacterized protein isoform X2 n=1 Tax=Aquarana catesbeiana TaxID=8400 RepID=UPI003CCA2589
MGMQKMATYVAVRGLLLLCLLVFIVPAKALKCHSCLGTLKECKLKEVTCPGSNDTCGSSLMVVKSFPFKENSVLKGCVSSKTPHRNISLSPSAIVKLTLEENTCDTDLCNKETIQVPEAKENDLNCYSCISSGKDCNSDTISNLKCRGQQDKCLDIFVLGNLGDVTNTNLKGCGEMNCSGSLMYTSRQSSVFVKCCNENFCNSEIGFKQPDQTPNGLECISCNTIEDESCSPLNSTTQCYGSLTSCYELAGINMQGGKPTLAMLKGCATPNMCDSLVLPLLANLRGSRIRCCNGSHCNNNFTKDTLQGSGYFPETGNVNGHGNSTSSTGYHAGENRGNSSNVLVGSSPPGWHGNTNGSHSMPKDNGYGYGNGSGSGNSSIANNSEQKPPVGNHNSTENGLYHGNDTNLSNSSTHNNGLISNSKPSAVHNNGSSNGTNSSSSNLNMTSTGGSYNGSSSSNHSTLGANHNGSSVGTSSGSKPVSTDNVHSYSNGSNWSNSSVHNPHMLSPGGYNGSYGYNSTFNNSGHSYVGSSNPNSTSGGAYFNNSNPKPNSENGLYLGNGTTRSNSSTHNGSDPTSTGNVHSNSSYLGNYGGNSSSHHNPHIMPPGGHYINSTLNGSNPNITTGGGYFHNSIDENSSSYWNYDPNMLPPVMNGPPEGYFPGNSYDSNYSMYGAEGTSNGNIFMPPGGISHGESNGNQNDSSSSYWNSYPNMPPPAIPGHYGNLGSNISYHLLPGLNGSATDNYNNIINILSNATGLSPTVLSQRLKGVDLNKPGNLAAVLSSFPGFDPNRLPPALKTAIFGYNNNVSHTFHNTTGYNNHMHPSNWNISNLANNSYFLNVLSNMTNVSVAVLSQKLNELNKGNQHNLTALLFSLPDFDLYKLPSEFRKEIFGMDTNLNYTNTDGFNHNMAPPGSGFGNNSHYGNVGNNGTSNLNTSLSGKDTDTANNGAPSLRSKAGVLTIVLTITLLYVTELK